MSDCSSNEIIVWFSVCCPAVQVNVRADIKDTANVCGLDQARLPGESSELRKTLVISAVRQPSPVSRQSQPSSALRPPLSVRTSSVLRPPSAVLRVSRPSVSAVLRQPSSVSRPPSAVLRQPSSVSAVLRQTSSVSRHPSAVLRQPSSVSRQTSAVSRQPTAVLRPSVSRPPCQPSSVSRLAVLRPPSAVSPSITRPSVLRPPSSIGDR